MSMEIPPTTLNKPPSLEESRLRTIIQLEATISGARSGGPGGQNVNKVNSKAVLEWYPEKSHRLTPEEKNLILNHCTSHMEAGGYFNLTCDTQRGWHQNRTKVIEKLVDLILEATKPEIERVETRPTRASREKRLDTKKKAGVTKAGRQWKPDHD